MKRPRSSTTKVGNVRVPCVRLGKKVLVRQQTPNEKAAWDAKAAEYRRGYINGARMAMEEAVRQMGVVTRDQSDDRLNGILDSIEGIIRWLRHTTKGHPAPNG